MKLTDKHVREAAEKIKEDLEEALSHLNPKTFTLARIDDDTVETFDPFDLIKQLTGFTAVMASAVLHLEPEPEEDEGEVA